MIAAMPARSPRKQPISRGALRAYSALLRAYLGTGVPPSLDQIASAARLAGRSSARAAMLALQRKGLVRRVRGMYVPTDVVRMPPRCPSCGTTLNLTAAPGGARWTCRRCSPADKTPADGGTR